MVLVKKVVNEIKQLISCLRYLDKEANEVFVYDSSNEVKQLELLLHNAVTLSQSFLTKLDAHNKQVNRELEIGQHPSQNGLTAYVPVHQRQAQWKTTGHKTTSVEKKGTKRALQPWHQPPAEKRQKQDDNAQLISLWMSGCAAILKKLEEHGYAWIFLEPVDPVKLNLPDYYQIIKSPMDLGTVKKKLEKKEYTSRQQFAKDVRLTFANAKKYNPKDQDPHFMANVMSCIFEKHWKTFNSTFNQRLRAGGWGNCESDDVAQDMLSSTRFSAAERFNNKLKTPANKSSSEPGLKKHKCLPVKSTKSIGRVPNIRPLNLVVDRGSVMSISTGQTVAKWQQLDRTKNNGLKKPPERELNEPRSRGQIITEEQSTDNAIDARELYQTSFKVQDEDPQDEYVDIGDNMQLSSIPPVIIDRNGCSSSSSSGSSSSSSSGSSSSSNISGSDTDSESDADSSQFVSSAQASPIKEPLYNETRANFPLTEGPAHEKTFLDERAETHEGSPHEITLLGERADTQEDEMVKQGNQVSPGRLVRETLLKNRFADIILKSKEQLQPQKEDTADTEKLRREREELQKQKKQSIQAQPRNGAAIVASSGMLQREADRQAAREALIQLELAVEPIVSYDIMEGLDSMGSFFKSGISLSSMINQKTDLYQGGKIQI